MIDTSTAVMRATGATRARDLECIQELWSGYGQIRRVAVEGTTVDSVVVKHVSPPRIDDSRHPRGWATRRSHERKLRSYAVECEWYARYAAMCDSTCRVPRAFEVTSDATVDGTPIWFLVLEDLDVAGFPGRRSEAGRREIEACLSWLASFHARFLSVEPQGLWDEGTYWHLATRPDELEAMEDRSLRSAAAAIDRRLASCSYRTFVHGDAKLANFCFSRDGRGVAAVDFQYVGGGCGMKDVAYFLSSCMTETELAERADDLLDYYFAELRRAIQSCNSEGDADRDGEVDLGELEREWRGLYAFAWADFFRFLNGWAPGHYKVHGYSRQMTEVALHALGET